jgi:hypothetical protein
VIDSPPNTPSPIAGPSRLPTLDVIGRHHPILEPSSDFDYEAAMKSDILDATLHRIAYGTSDTIDVPIYPVGDSDDEILASDPSPIPFHRT